MARKVSGGFSESVSGNDTLENLWIDAGGDHVRINLRDSATLKNVAITNASNHPAPIHVAADSGDSITIENVYVKGVNDNCIFVNEKHSGDCLIKNCYLGDAVEDAVYGSPAGNPTYRSGKANPGGQEGLVRIENSMAEDCNDYGFRIGSPGSYVKNSVVKNCGTALANLYGKNKGCSFIDVDVLNCEDGLKHIDHDDRNVGDWPEEVTTHLDNVRMETSDTDILRFETAAGGGTIIGDVSGNPQDRIPEGMPTSPEMAYEGRSGEGDQSPSVDSQHVVLDGTDVEGKVFYRFVGHAGKVEAGPDANVGDGEERVDERTWDGRLGGGSDNYEVFSESTPHITSVKLEGLKSDVDSVQVYLNEENVTDSIDLEKVYVDEEQEDSSNEAEDEPQEESEMSTITLSTERENGAYFLAVRPGKKIEKSTEGEATIDGGESIIKGPMFDFVKGTVWGGTDGYDTDADDIRVFATDNVTVEVDGTEIDAEAIEDRPNAEDNLFDLSSGIDEIKDLIEEEGGVYKEVEVDGSQFMIVKM